MVSFPDWVNGLSVDSIGGSERIPSVDTSTSVYFTTDQLVTYVGEQLAAASGVTVTTGDKILMDRSGTAGTFTVEELATYSLDYLFDELTVSADVQDGDNILIDRSGAQSQVTVDSLKTYINNAVLDLTALTAATPSSTDLFVFGAGSNPRKITLSDLETKLWQDFGTYVAALTAVETPADHDVVYVQQGGTVKKVLLSVLSSYFDVGSNVTIAPDTTIENRVPQWDSTAKTLKVGLTLVTDVRTIPEGASDEALATELGVRKAVGTYQNVYIDAGSMVPCTTDGATAAVHEFTNNDVDIEYLAFDGATRERAQFKVPMPEDWDRGPIKAGFYWSAAEGSSVNDTVEWAIKAIALGDSDQIDATFGAAVAVSDALAANDGADVQITAATSELTVGGSPELRDLVVFEVYRNVTGSDDMTEDAWLLGVKLQYTKTATIEQW